MPVNVLDIICVAIILIFVISAAIKGFINEIFGKGAPVISIWLAYVFYRHLSPHFYNFINNQLVCNIISFVIIFVLVFLVIKIIQKIVWDIFNKDVFVQLDRILGFVLGLAEGIFVAALLIIVLKSQPWFDVSSFVDSSFCYKILSKFITIPINGVKSFYQNKADSLVTYLM